MSILLNCGRSRSVKDAKNICERRCWQFEHSIWYFIFSMINLPNHFSRRRYLEWDKKKILFINLLKWYFLWLEASKLLNKRVCLVWDWEVESDRISHKTSTDDESGYTLLQLHTMLLFSSAVISIKIKKPRQNIVNCSFYGCTKMMMLHERLWNESYLKFVYFLINFKLLFMDNVTFLSLQLFKCSRRLYKVWHNVSRNLQTKSFSILKNIIENLQVFPLHNL